VSVDPQAFRFSDLVTGYVEWHDPGRGLLGLRSDSRPLRVEYRPGTAAELLRNLGQPYRDASGRLADLLRPGRLVFAHGTFDPGSEGLVFEARRLVLPQDGGDRPGGDWAFEDPGWWVRQLDELASFYRRAQFGDSPVDFADYRTILRLGGDKADDHTQETDTISRLVYGMASAYLLTGDERHLAVAEAGTDYLRDHLRFVDQDEDVVYWYHGMDVRDGVESKLFASEFGDDYRVIPAYEQIYALVGPTQTYRLTGDRRILDDVEGTLRLFSRFFHDPTHGGWFSHVDPIELSPHHPSLGPNRARKNWNSVGDHAPAYLVNLFLATEDQRHADMLEESFDLIVAHLPDPHSPFVHERFHSDWLPDREWGWQQDRAVVGHNLKIAWNLSRMQSIRPKEAYRRLAEKIGRTMPAVGSDTRRGGWYDMVDRLPGPDGRHRLVWHDRKAWWQQEQAILAYLLMAGRDGDEVFRRHAREAAAFYNAFFLDHDEGGVYFNVLADGTPYLLGTERLKGSHSMSMYHAAELCLLATVYQRLLLQDEPLDLWFRPGPDGFGPDRLLRVAPDALPPGSVRLESVELDGVAHHDFDPVGMVVRLPVTDHPLTVRARLRPPTDRWSRR
jgi:mannose/cellobiose epimerase-like protein (N-acyl-D-glucosamine 2-epimerase family)